MLVSGRRRGAVYNHFNAMGEERARDEMEFSAVGPSEMHDVENRQVYMVARRRHQFQPQPSRLPTCQRCIPRGFTIQVFLASMRPAQCEAGRVSAIKQTGKWLINVLE